MVKRLLKPLISTVIPTYRRPKMLKKAIQSVLDQSYPNFSIIVMDNASGDETQSIVEGFKDERIKYYCQPQLVTVYENYQGGLDKVDTPYFSFLADDDYLLPSFYENAITCLEKEPTVAFFSSGTFWCNDKGRVLRYWRIKREGLWDARSCPIKDICNPFWMLNFYSLVFRRKLPTGELLDFDRTFTGKVSWCLEFVWRVMSQYRSINIAEPGYVYVTHNSSMSSGLPWKDAYADVELAIRTLLLQAKNNPPFQERLKKASEDWLKWAFYKRRSAIVQIFQGHKANSEYVIGVHQTKKRTLLTWALVALRKLCQSSLIRRAFISLHQLYGTSKHFFFYSKLQRKYNNTLQKFSQS